MFEGAIHHIGVLQQAQYQQPWGLLNSPSSSSVVMSKSFDSMITRGVDLRGSSECADHINLGIHNNTSMIIDTEDFFIGDLSDFSNEDIAAPIKNASLLLMDGLSSFQLSSDDNTSASNSKGPPSAVNSDSTKSTAHISTPGSVFFHASPTALDNFDSSLHIEMDDSLALPCQNEAGFEWLTSFGEDNLICDGASNFGMDSFLLSNAEPKFDGGYDGLMMHGGYEDDSSLKGVKAGLPMNDATTNDVQGQCGGDHFRWQNENADVKEFDAIMFIPYSTGSRSARTKRASSAGWSSSNILCNNWDNDSPTTSLSSTSQIMPNPPYSSPTLILPKPEEIRGEQHGNIPTQAHNVEVIASMLNHPNRDKPCNKASNFSSSILPDPNGWAKEVENTRQESVSNYGGVQPRRCTHCLSQKTPQWRAGPQGPKTLCNACGVRFKSGRLFDEYRPAKSPTFLSYKHSNSHKKVMEMRRRKTLPYNHYHHHQQQQGAHQACAAPRLFKHAEVDSHLGNKLKIKLNPSSLEPHSHFSDVTLISTRSAIESPSSFLY